MDPAHLYDVLVVGGGPAGASAAYWLASQGHDVVVVERRTFPQAKTCGDALTPRAVVQLHNMGLAAELSRFHRYSGVRVRAHGQALDVPWPQHPTFPNFGYVARRHELDALIIQRAADLGVRVREGFEAIAPIIERGFVRGAVIRSLASDERSEIRARFVIVADGANSRFGRSLGTTRTKSMPYGTAIRGYWASPLHAEALIESTLDVRDRNGAVLPGYGWVFPLGDGTVNVGVGLLSTFRDFKSINTTHLLEEFVATAADRWQLQPGSPEGKPAAGRLPMGGSVGPKSGQTYVVVGDAAGMINPFNGAGIDYALETGRLGARLVHEAIALHDPRALAQYSRLIDEDYGQYFRVARLFARIAGRPVLLREMTRTGIHSRTLMAWTLRLMSNMLSPDEMGPAEAAYAAIAQLSRLIPDA